MGTQGTVLCVLIILPFGKLISIKYSGKTNYLVGNSNFFANTENRPLCCKTDHIFAPEEFAKLPEKLASPVAIIADPSDGNLVVFVDMVNAGGKQTIVPFKINDELRIGNQKIELQRIESVHGNQEAENMLRGAILRDSPNNIRLYYVNDKKSRLEFVRPHKCAGARFPAGASIV